jgi:hypothetical protein
MRTPTPITPTLSHTLTLLRTRSRTVCAPCAHPAVRAGAGRRAPASRWQRVQRTAAPGGNSGGEVCVWGSLNEDISTQHTRAPLTHVHAHSLTRYQRHPADVYDRQRTHAHTHARTHERTHARTHARTSVCSEAVDPNRWGGCGADSLSSSPVLLRMCAFVSGLSARIHKCGTGGG